MRVTHFILILAAVTLLTSCSLVAEPQDESPLRTEYARKTDGSSSTGLYVSTVTQAVVIGGASQAIPGFHLLGLFADVGAVVYFLDELIYGTGAIVSRQMSCPALLEKQDYWHVLGAWFQGVRSSAEFDTAMSLAATMTPLITREQAHRLFVNAVQLHGSKFVGVKLAGVIAAKMTAKGVAGFIPALGPIVAGGINWYIFSGIDDAANAYFQSKARLVCRAH